jgi:hypothetical protein
MEFRMTAALMVAVPPEMLSSRRQVRRKAGSGVEEVDPQTDRKQRSYN